MDENRSIEELESKVNAHKKAEEQKIEQLQSHYFKNTPFKILIDLISGIAVGVFLGYSVDRYLNTFPIALFIFSVLGMVGGLFNIYRDLDKK